MPNKKRSTTFLWEFLLELLDGKEACPAICWLDRDRGMFVLKDQSVIAELWGKLRGRPNMDKIKLGRALRYYYKTGMLAKVPRRKATYRFTNFDELNQKRQEPKIMLCDDLPEIDLNDESVLALIGDEKGHHSTFSILDLEDGEDILYDETFTAETHFPVVPNEVYHNTGNFKSFNEITEQRNGSYGFECNFRESPSNLDNINKEGYSHSTCNLSNLPGNQCTGFDSLKALLPVTDNFINRSQRFPNSICANAVQDAITFPKTDCNHWQL